MAAVEEPASKRMKTEENEDAGMDVDAMQAPVTPNKEQLHMSMAEMTKLYYGRFFPFKHMHKWLAYGNDLKHPQADASFFVRREFCFTLDGDIFVRYQSFKDATDMAEAVKFKCPTKIDIGPVYNKPPQQRALYAGQNSGADRFAPVERELVFDIDLTDYDDVRTCCTEGSMCNRCWTFMAAAVKVLDAALREDFAFQHILWVYSGRRGVHCWVCDERARQMTDEQRSSVAGYLSVFKGTDKDRAKVAASLVLHPAVHRAHETLKRAWEEVILPEQRLLGDESQWDKVLQYIPDAGVADALRSRWRSSNRRFKSDLDLSVVRWHDIEEEVRNKARSTHSKRGARPLASQQLEHCLEEIVLAFTYPRLDVEVSKKRNHLLKAPFCIHPKTGKVCVPFDPEEADQFNPEQVVTVQQLLQELQNITSHGAEAWRQTSMSQCIELFENKFLNDMEKSFKAALTDKARAVAQAPKMDW